MRLKFCLFFCLLVLHQELAAKIRFFSFQFNRPEFLEFQSQLLKKFVLDDYELIVFNDAKDLKFQILIEEVCEKNRIECIRFEPDWHKTSPLNEYIYRILNNPNHKNDFVFERTDGKLTLEGISKQSSIRHNHVIQYALDHYGYDHDDIVVILDHDLFPIRPISIRELLKETPLIGMKIDEKHPYLWVPFFAFDPTRLPNVRDLKLHCDVINGYFYDTGAHTYYYLKENPNVSSQAFQRSYDREFYHLPEEALKAFGFAQEEIDLIKSMPWPGCIEFYVDYHFLHYGVGSADFHPVKEAGVLKYLQRLVNRPF